MKATASPTVFRFLTSSSGMVTPNFSSASTTTSTIDSESTSRSSTKDLSIWTSSASTPATSLTISARAARISSVLICSPASFTWDGNWASGEGNHLGCVRQPGTERDQQGDVARLGLALADHPLERERDGRCGGVARVDDVAGDPDVGRKLHRPRHRVRDPVVGLVRHEAVELVDADAGPVEGLERDLGHRERRPSEDLVAPHGQVRHLWLVGGDDVAPVLPLPDQVVLLTVGAPDHRADGGYVGRPDDDGTGAVGEDEGRAAVGRAGDVGEPL